MTMNMTMNQTRNLNLTGDFKGGAAFEVRSHTPPKRMLGRIAKWVTGAHSLARPLLSHRTRLCRIATTFKPGACEQILTVRYISAL